MPGVWLWLGWRRSQNSWPICNSQCIRLIRFPLAIALASLSMVDHLFWREHPFSLTEWGSRLVFRSPHPRVCIDLVACTSNETFSLSDVFHPRVVLLTAPLRRASPTQLRYINHSDVGGVTTHPSQFLLFNCPTFKLQSTVRRSIGCVIEHKQHLPSSDDKDNCISSEDLLPIRAINTPIWLPSRWNISGFATRSLASTELCSAFDLPKWCLQDRQVSFSFFWDIIPIKGQLAIIDFLLPTIAPPGTRIGALQLEQLEERPTNPCGEWITANDVGIDCVPLSWIDSTLVTDKAVKTDKASVPVHLWDQHVCLPLGVIDTSTLPILRSFFYCCYGKRLIGSFCEYMTLAYGEGWLHWIAQEENLKQYLWLVREQLKQQQGGVNKTKRKGVIIE